MTTARLGPYLLRRLGWAVLTLLGVTLVTFLVAYLLPADPARMVAGPYATAAAVASIRRQLGLDRPLDVQFALYLWNALHGNLGVSFIDNQPVAQMIAQRFPATLELGLAGTFIELLIGIPVGIAAAVRQNSWVDRALSSALLVGLAAPQFWLGVMFLYLFAFRLPLFPLGGYGGFSHLILPAATLGVTGAAFYARLLRSSMIETKVLEYVTTARAKGLTTFQVVVRHIMRAALTPVVTYLGMNLAFFLGGLIVIETVFGWPGIGYMTFQAIQNVDIPVILGVVLFAAVLVVVLNLVVDLLYLVLDPRIKYE